MAPNRFGYLKNGSIDLDGLKVMKSFSPQWNKEYQGLVNLHISPTKADKYANPTHHITHTKVGAML